MSACAGPANVLKLPCGVLPAGMGNMGSNGSRGRGEKLDFSEKGVVLSEGRC